jgi:hypothetical protein
MVTHAPAPHAMVIATRSANSFRIVASDADFWLACAGTSANRGDDIKLTSRELDEYWRKGQSGLQ